MIRSALLVCTLITINSAVAQMQNPPASRDLVIRYFGLVGFNAQLDALPDQIIAEQQKGFAFLRPDIPSETWDSIRADVRKDVNTSNLLDRLIAIFQQHFTNDEMSQIVAFYESPSGRKLAETQFMLSAEMYLAESGWKTDAGQHIGQRIVELAKARGYDLDRPAKKAGKQ